MSDEALLNSYFRNNNPLPDRRLPLLQSHRDQLDKTWALLEHERLHTEALIDERFATIRALEKEIAWLNRVRRRAILRKTAVSAQRGRYETLIAPIRQVPPEILANIANMATSGGADIRAMFKFQLVCRLWQETCVSTPSLWRRLIVNASCSRMVRLIEPKPRLQQTLLFWFSRAGNGAALDLAVKEASQQHLSDTLGLVSSLGLSTLR